MRLNKIAIRLSTQLCVPPRKARDESIPDETTRVRLISARTFCTTGMRFISKTAYRKTARNVAECSSGSLAETFCAHNQCTAKIGAPTRINARAWASVSAPGKVRPDEKVV